MQIDLMRPRAKHTLIVTFLSLVLGLLSLATLMPSRALAQDEERRFHIEEYNSDITINRDGSLDVTETLVYVYDRGTFQRGIRQIPLGRVESITDVRVEETEGGQNTPYVETSFNADDSSTSSRVPQTYGTEIRNGNLRIRWIYPSTSNDTRTFRIMYHVTGVIRVYDDRDVLNWSAVPPDAGGDIASSRIEVSLPDNINLDLIKMESDPKVNESKGSNSLIWSANNVSSGLSVGAQFPKGAVQATKPPWQVAVDEQERTREEYNKNVRPLVDLAMLLLGALLLVGGVLWNILRWYKAGRDKPVKLFSDYLADPPSNLPPGLVGTLLDESADVRDVIATLVDQGTKGNLTMQELGASGLLSSKDFEYRRINSNVQYRFEDMALTAVFKGSDTTKLSELKNTFYSSLPPIYDEMYRNLVALKYFPENPKAVRNRNRAGGVGLILLGGLVFFGGIIFGEDLSYFLVLPGIALMVTGFLFTLLAGAMPRKTDFGSEETAKWRAFAKYLQQMQQYTDVQAAADKFQKYLPYAVALGIERQLINQFNSVPTAMPPWYAPVGYSPVFYPYPIGTSVGSGQASTGPGGGGGVPQLDPGAAMQGMSDSFGGAMQNMSNSFTDMVNSASNALTSTPSSSGSSSGGGWSGGGGGFSSGGSSGGGSAGAD